MEYCTYLTLTCLPIFRNCEVWLLACVTGSFLSTLLICVTSTEKFGNHETYREPLKWKK